MKQYHINNGWLQQAQHCNSPHFSKRCAEDGDISLLVIHNISLPPRQFGGSYIEDFFVGELDNSQHPFFEEIANLKVSAHCLIKRNGEVVQFVNFHDKAWHAGVSCYQGRNKCNDFSIGIELEGCDDIPYTESQYQSLAAVTQALLFYFPKMQLEHIVGHCDIAPERKTDPGEAFDWPYFRQKLTHLLKKRV